MKKSPNACPACGELVDVGEGFDSTEATCDGCGAFWIWTAFTDGSFGLVDAGATVEDVVQEEEA